ncbi:MAG: sigma-54-dependent Fis family transcriptional regulator [Acidobacteriota bacterium]|nr:sigma-54-dependent Fis family transcriptional regulator [Blastocatellia bacterium]MDW8240650.1 sigma-54-dependent Fis family transcriptional regulator [Acidobacteriota bacterium]
MSAEATLPANFLSELLGFASRPASRLDGLLRLLLEKALKLTGSDVGGGILIFAAEGQQPTLVTSVLEGELADTLSNLLRAWQQHRRSPALIVFNSGQAYSSDDHRQEPVYFPLLAGSRSSVWVPLLDGKQVVGVLHVEASQAGHYGEREVVQLEELAAEAVAAINRLLLKEWMAHGGAWVEIVGASPAFVALERQLKQVAGSASRSVLLSGERGSGKELAARAIHYWSERRDKPFVPVLVSAMTESMVADELFGHERYAFTDAKQARKGKFRAADGGTLFLDEVGDLSPAVQAALLRAIQWGEIQPGGRDLPVRVDVRVVATTNQHLPELIAQGRFRQDLYDRLRVVEIRVPPLRERREDIRLLAEHFLRKYCQQTRREVMSEGVCAACSQTEEVCCATAAFYEALQAYDWPGNVRELENLIIRLLTDVRDEVLDVKHLPEEIRRASMQVNKPTVEELRLDVAMKRHIELVLRMTNYNQRQAAKILRIPYSTLQNKIKKLGVEIKRKLRV